MTTEPRALRLDLFSKGAEYDGFEDEAWTRAHVGEIIKPHVGVSYEVSMIGLLLKELGLTLFKKLILVSITKLTQLFLTSPAVIRLQCSCPRRQRSTRQRLNYHQRVRKLYF